jgi:phosphate transport system substrate-binding protein
MIKKLSSVLAASALAATTLLVGPAAFAETSTAGGASYTLALQTACTAAYTKHQVTYANQGSGRGKSGFVAGTNEWAGSDSLYGATEVKPKNFTYVPILGGPIAMIYNIPGVTRLNLTPAVISGIYTGKITKWDDAAIKADNKSAKLPNETIVPVYRSGTSGTTNNFANFLNQTADRKWVANDAFATAIAAVPGGLASNAIGGNLSTGVITSVKTTGFSIGYVDLGDAIKNSLPAAHVKNGSGQFVAPGVATSAKFIAAQTIKPTTGQVLFDYNKKVPGAYSLSLVSYAIAPTKNGTAKGDAARDYLTYFVNECAPAKAASEYFVSLSGPILATAQKLLAKID